MSEELTARAASRVGTVLAGKYRLERVIGVGGMASVYEAVHRNGRRVAVKVLHPELAHRADIRERFVREGIAANAIKHPGVVDVLDDELDADGNAFLVMEYLEGETVERAAERAGGRLPPRQVMLIARDLCDVMAAAHAAGVIHRDIKPENLFLTNDGDLKVLDFGIARVRDLARAELTRSGAMLGTPAFMAPEQAKGLILEVDEQTDVWSIGATLFTLLAGKLVHEADTAMHLAVLAATKPARSLASVAPELPSELVRLVDRALVTSKADRWPSAEAMGEAIAALLRGDTLSSKTTPMADRPGAHTEVMAPGPEQTEVMPGAPTRPDQRKR